MSDLKSRDELKALHGEAYAKRFDQTQDEYRLSRLRSLIPMGRHDDVVDFACGSAMLMPLVAPNVGTYTGVDFSQAFIDIAKKKAADLGLDNARFECTSIEEFCARNSGKFQTAFAMDFSEHVYDEDWLRILIAIRATLKTGGHLYLHTPNADFFLEMMKRRNFIVKQFPEHIAVRTLRANAALLEQAGFRIEHVAMLAHYNILRLLHPLSYLPIIGIFFKARIFIGAAR